MRFSMVLIIAHFSKVLVRNLSALFIPLACYEIAKALSIIYHTIECLCKFSNSVPPGIVNPSSLVAFLFSEPSNWIINWIKKKDCYKSSFSFSVRAESARFTLRSSRLFCFRIRSFSSMFAIRFIIASSARDIPEPGTGQCVKATGFQRGLTLS